MCFVTNYIATTPKNKNKSLRSIVFKLPQIELIRLLEKYLQENEFDVEEVTKDFYEIFATKGNKEFTFSLLADGSKTILGIYLFAPDNRFSKKKTLINLTNDIKSSFKQHLI